MTYVDAGITIIDIIIEITGVDSDGQENTETIFNGNSNSPINLTHAITGMFATPLDNEIIITINTAGDYGDESYGVFNNGRLLINIDCVYEGDDDAVGVCCEGLTCNIRTYDECNALNGTYLGDGTTCEYEEGDEPPCGTPGGGT